MADMAPIARRGFLGLVGAAGVVAWAPARAAASAHASPAVTLARQSLARQSAANPLSDRVGLADFALPSRLPRFFLVDLEAGRITAHLVSHGRGSDPAHTGLLQRFSNAEGSFASSEGAYLTSGAYVGRHGRSMRLVGLEQSNSNAEARAIVIHAADYVSAAIARTHGKIGRSHGCFAFAPGELDLILTALGPGRLLVAGRFGLA